MSSSAYIIEVQIAEAYKRVRDLSADFMIVSNNVRTRSVRRWKGRKFVMKRSFYEAWKDFQRFGHVI